MEVPRGGETWGELPVPPGTLQDAYVIELVNTGTSPVLLDRVELIKEKDAAPLRLDGAYVAPSGTPMRIDPAGRGTPRLPTLHGYCLPHTAGVHAASILVLRVGPARQPGGFRLSRNNCVNLHYRTADGQRYDAVYAVRISYPVQRGDPATQGSDAETGSGQSVSLQRSAAVVRAQVTNAD
jgi:hypothetical protein